MRSLRIVLIAAMAFTVALPGVEPALAAPECSDGFDNDGDGETDFPEDAACESSADDHEELPRPSSICRGSPLRVGEMAGAAVEPVVANESLRPCADDAEAVLPPTPIDSLLVVSALEAGTFEMGFIGGGFVIAFAQSRVAGAGVIGPSGDITVLDVHAALAFALAECRLDPSQNAFFGESIVIGVTRLDQPPVLLVPPGHQHLSIPGIGTLHLNEKTVTSTSITVRAVWLETERSILPDVVLGEAIAGC